MLNKRILVLMFVVAFLLVGCLPTPTPPNEAPIITSTPITTATIGVLYTYDVNATDPDGDTLTYFLTVKPSGMTINSVTGLIKWTPTAKGNYAVTVKVSDGSLSIAQGFKIKVGTLPPVNHAPTINSIPVTTATVGVTYVYDVEATDPDDDVLTYSLTAYPSGMTISSTTGLIVWTPTVKGNYAVVVKVSDGVLSDTQGFTIVVSKPSVPPETYTITASTGSGGSIYPPGVVTVNEGENIVFIITPDTGYSIKKVLVDRSSVGAVGLYPFNNVTKDHAIHATFSTVEPEPEPEIELTGIVVDPKTMDLFVGKSEAIESVTATYEVRGTEVTIALEECTYESDDDEVATVSDVGLVKAIKVGTATITVDYEGKTDTIAVTVSEPELIGIEVEPNKVTLLTASTQQLEVTAYYDDGNHGDITSDCIYVSSDSGIASVDDNGLVTAEALGKTTITVTYTPDEIVFADIVEVTVGPVYNVTHPAYYNTITDAIAIVSATAGDTIEVAAGLYVGNLEIYVENLTLKSTVQHGAVIQTEAGFNEADGYGGITVLADGVTIDGFEIVQGVDQAIIHTHYSHDVTIKNNRIISADGARPRGIDVGYAPEFANSDRVTIEGNEFYELACGILVGGGNNLTVKDNTFSTLDYSAIGLDKSTTVENTYNILIKDNVVTDADYLINFTNIVGLVTVEGNTLINTELTNAIDWID